MEIRVSALLTAAVFFGVFSMVFVDRAQADVITVLSQSYEAFGRACVEFDCITVGSSSPSPVPVTYHATFPDGSTADLGSTGEAGRSGGSIRSFTSSSLYPPIFQSVGETAFARMKFQVDTDSEAVVYCHASTSFSVEQAEFIDVTTNTGLLQCVVPTGFDGFVDSISKSATVFLNPTDTYELATDAAIGFPGDAGLATINFQVPEPSTLCVLGIALSFGLFRTRQDKRKGPPLIANRRERHVCSVR
jgi:hypothetical protein